MYARNNWMLGPKAFLYTDRGVFHIVIPEQLLVACNAYYISHALGTTYLMNNMGSKRKDMTITAGLLTTLFIIGASSTIQGTLHAIQFD